MTVHFIGAGPGAPDLITVRGLALIRRCPVCLYAGSLVPLEVVAYAPEGARVIDTAPMTLDDIIAEIEAAHAQLLSEGRRAVDDARAAVENQVQELSTKAAQLEQQLAEALNEWRHTDKAYQQLHGEMMQVLDQRDEARRELATIKQRFQMP